MPAIEIKQLHSELDEYARRLGLPPAPENFCRDILTADQRRRVKRRLKSREHIVRIWASLQGWTEIQACVDLARRLLSLGDDRVASLLRDLKQPPLVTPPRPESTPIWDKVTGQLTLDGVICWQLDRPAENCVAVLDSFQLNNWIKRIEDPFHRHPHARHETIKIFNKKCQHIHLRSANTGIVWEHGTKKVAAMKVPPRSKSVSRVKQNPQRKPRPR